MLCHLATGARCLTKCFFNILRREVEIGIKNCERRNEVDGKGLVILEDFKTLN